jgi:hypothetical protein
MMLTTSSPMTTRDSSLREREMMQIQSIRHNRKKCQGVSVRLFPMEKANTRLRHHYFTLDQNEDDIKMCQRCFVVNKIDNDDKDSRTSMLDDITFPV